MLMFALLVVLLMLGGLAVDALKAGTEKKP